MDQPGATLICSKTSLFLCTFYRLLVAEIILVNLTIGIKEKEKKQQPADVATDKQGRLKLHYCISTSMHILLKMFVTLL